MSERISHESALSLAGALPGAYHTRDALLRYIAQQQASESAGTEALRSLRLAIDEADMWPDADARAAKDYEAVVRFMGNHVCETLADTVSFCADPEFVEVYKYEQNPTTGRVRIRPTELRAAGWVPAKADTVSRAEHEAALKELTVALVEAEKGEEALQSQLTSLQAEHDRVVVSRDKYQAAYGERHDKWCDVAKERDDQKATADELRSIARQTAEALGAVEGEFSLTAAVRVARERDALKLRVEALESEHERAMQAAVRTIGELQDVIAGVADGYEQQEKFGIASQLRQFLPADLPPQANTQTPPSPSVAEEPQEWCVWHSSGACSQCGLAMSRAENGIRKCTAQEGPDQSAPAVAVESVHTCRDDDPTLFCVACNEAEERELGEAPEPAQPAPSGTERRVNDHIFRGEDLTDACDLCGEPWGMRFVRKCPALVDAKLRKLLNPTPAEPHGRPEQAGDRPGTTTYIRALLSKIPHRNLDADETRSALRKLTMASLELCNILDELERGRP